MNVLVITETLNNGGAELFTLRLIRYLRLADVEATLVSMNKRHENHEMTSQFVDIPITRLHLPFLKLIEKLDYVLLRCGIDFSLKYFLQKRQLSRLIQKQNPQIVHTHTIQIDHLVAQIRKRNSSFRQVVTVHGDYSAQYAKMQKGIGLVWLNLPKKLQFLKKHVDFWALLSSEQEIFFKEVMQLTSNFKKVYNGFVDFYKRTDDSVIKNFTKNNFIFGLIARGEKEKGWQLLIDAFDRLPENCRLILAGEGNYLDDLKQKHSYNKRILFTGFYPDPLGLLKNVHVLVLPTLYPFESLPTVVIEALYMGVPVIASDIHEIGNMIRDDETLDSAGYLIPFDGTRPDPDELYFKMLYLYENPHVLQKLSQTAKKAFVKFDMETCILTYKEIYSKLVNN